MKLCILICSIIWLVKSDEQQVYHSKLRILGSNKTENDAKTVPEKLTKPVILSRNNPPPLLYTYKLLPNPHHLQQLNFYGYRNAPSAVLEDRQYESRESTTTASSQELIATREDDNEAEAVLTTEPTTTTVATAALRFKYRLLNPTNEAPSSENELDAIDNEPAYSLNEKPTVVKKLEKVYAYSPLPTSSNNEAALHHKPVVVINSLPPVRGFNYHPTFYHHFYHPAPLYPSPALATPYTPPPVVVTTAPPIQRYFAKPPRLIKDDALADAEEPSQDLQVAKGFPTKPKEVVPPPDIEHVSLGSEIDQNIQREGRAKGQLDVADVSKSTTAAPLVNVVVENANKTKEQEEVSSQDDTKDSSVIEFSELVRGGKFASFDIKNADRKARKIERTPTAGAFKAQVIKQETAVEEGSFKRPSLEDFKAKKDYTYQYQVHAGQAYSHHEESKDGRTEGQYEVQLPDGRVQIVRYYADTSGFHPQIIYDD